ncbi:MAG TPA: ankyrin repeat domain-containing protein [Pseudomonas sp.]|uniref:ankyrin repeat domain-containing protein n=1 Tax=Pseudomonas sp. TaxID=306 RepID=UPI002BD67CC4|nr:ankyrin repeat domain-containing protein [Pseudomonas sp.]HTO19193.1 ankyrin repeat domain-containing protein [Pseudomonas sp.]
MRTLFRSLWLSCALFSSQVSAFDIDIAWMRLTGSIVLDSPERPFASSPTALPLGAGYWPVLSELNGLFYLNLYEDQRLRQRVHKLGPLPLFSREAFDALSDCDVDRWASRQALGQDLHLLTVTFNCPGAPTRGHLLLDGASEGAPRMAVGHAPDGKPARLKPLQPMTPERLQVWQAVLAAHAERQRSAGVILLPVQPAADAVEELRRLHAEAFRNKGALPSLTPLRDFLMRHDYRQVGRHEAEVVRLLNDTAYWLSEADRLAEARPLLLEVLRRDPQRTPAHLNLADLDWRLHTRDPHNRTHLARALEHYRVYCSLRLAGGQSVPHRVLENLQLPKASAAECRAHWPLLDAVRAADLAKVRSLLEEGIPGEVVGEDGYSALLLALQSLELEIAELLISHGAQLHGQYRGQTLAEHALQRDLKDNAPWPRLRFLALYGTVLEASNAQGVTLLMKLAADRRAKDAFDELLQLTQDLDKRDGDGKTALHRASEAQNFPAVNALLAAGADPNIESDGRLNCHNRNTRYTAIQLFARSLRSDGDPHASRESFSQLLSHGSKLAAGQRCEFNGHDVLLESLILAQRVDLMRLLADQAVLPTPTPALLDIARDRQRSARSEAQRERAQEVMDALLELGEPPLRSAL